MLKFRHHYFGRLFFHENGIIFQRFIVTVAELALHITGKKRNKEKVEPSQ